MEPNCVIVHNLYSRKHLLVVIACPGFHRMTCRAVIKKNLQMEKGADVSTAYFGFVNYFSIFELLSKAGSEERLRHLILHIDWLIAVVLICMITGYRDQFNASKLHCTLAPNATWCILPTHVCLHQPDRPSFNKNHIKCALIFLFNLYMHKLSFHLRNRNVSTQHVVLNFLY